MLSFLFSMAGLLNLLFYIFAVGFLISLGLEQWLKFRPLSSEETMNKRNMFIVQNNRKYIWRQISDSDSITFHSVKSIIHQDVNKN